MGILHLNNLPRIIKMENLHATFGEENLDFEIDNFKADMIRAIVSDKIQRCIRYNEITVVQFSEQWCSVVVNATGRRIEFRLP